MTSSRPLPEINAFAQPGGDPLVAWQSMAEDALRTLEKERKAIRKNEATSPSDTEFDGEIARLAKSLYRLHPAATESISATVSGTQSSASSFEQTLQTLATAGSSDR